MTDIDEYIDIREVHPGYTTVPCMECEADVLVNNGFAYNHDEWYCRACKPDFGVDDLTKNNVTVNL